METVNNSLQATAAVRSEDPELIEQVRSLTAECGMPLTIHPLGSAPPAADALFDSATESLTTDPSWQIGARVFHRISLNQQGTERGVRVLPQDSEVIRRTLEWSVAVQSAQVVGLVGSVGGVGTTCLAMNIARECAHQGIPAVLIDCDTRSSVGAYLELGEGTRWGDLLEEAALDDGYALIESLPVWQGVRVLTGSEISGYRENPLGAAVVGQLARTARMIVLDLGDSQVAEELAPWCDQTFIVTTADHVGLWGVRQLEQLVGRHHLGLVVRRTGPHGVSASEVEVATGLPVRGVLGHERSLRSSIERGLEPGDQRRGPVRRLARILGQQLTDAA